MPPDPADRAETFRALFAEVYPDVVRFVRRRADADVVDDVVGQTLLTWWRRFDEAPRGLRDVRPWVFGVARQILLNQWRSERRGSALAVRLAATSTAGSTPSAEETAIDRVTLAAAWRRLPRTHQETLALVVFEDLSAPEAARVLGVGAAAFRLRLMRARRALRASFLAAEPAPLTYDERYVTP